MVIRAILLINKISVPIWNLRWFNLLLTSEWTGLPLRLIQIQCPQPWAIDFFYLTFSLRSEAVNYESLESCLSSDLMGRMLDKGQIEMVVVPVKKVNKLKDTFREPKTRVAWVSLPSLLLYFTVFGHNGWWYNRKGTVFGSGSVT